MAANLIMEHRKRVGLISIDTYRIGAREQLKNYADILGIPCFQAFTPKDLGLALGRLQSKDVVLIDTAGQSQYDMARLEGLKTMLGKESSIDVHLLLSVGAAPPEMNETVLRFSPLSFKTYIFTKLDETRMMGNIINQVVKYPRPVSFVTAGQNVPEDIEKADQKKLSALMLKNRDETAITIGE
jgi:flagellar biosynthesis protein FlhF